MVKLIAQMMTEELRNEREAADLQAALQYAAHKIDYPVLAADNTG